MIPPNPAELIGTERFAQLVRELEKHYDKIIFDSPPVIAVADSMILSRLVDGVVMVIKCAQTSKDIARQSKRLLTDIKAPLLGAIINDLDLQNREYGYYYYYYYRRYGGYYGDRSEVRT
jgi:polysaccharide biosynthesis transport protein